MNPGILKHTIIIQQQKDEYDSYGDAEGWEDFRIVRAGIFPLSGRELFAAEQAQSEITHRIVMRYTSGVTPRMRIIYDGRIFGIEYVINKGEANAELELRCREIVK